MESRKRKSAIENYIDGLEDPPEKLQKTAAFYHGLKLFYRRKWNAPLKLPHVQGVEVNLFRLYDTVMAMGGWQKVQEKWSDVADILGVGDDVLCGDHAIKLIYMRYLSKFEQVETIGDIDDLMDGELSRGRGRQSSFFATNECPISLGRTTEFIRRDERGNPSTEPEYSRVMRSLLSGLPNEVDFGVNVCTLLSHPGPRLLRLSHAPHIPTVLVALVGIFDEDECDLSDLYPGWTKNSGRDFAAFWANSGAPAEFLEKFCPLAGKQSVDKDADLFHGLAAEYDVRNPMSWRLNQIATIIRNFSFEAVNRVTLTQSWALMKFIFLCASSKWVPLYTAAMDTLSNIATDIDLTSPRMGEDSGFAILRILKEGVLSNDKFKVIRAMEIFTGLCMYEGNEAIITDFVTNAMIERIFNVICVKDIMMCVYALECLYQFSEMGDVACDLICKNTSCVQQLVAMTTLEAVSFGQAGLAGMKVVEYQPPPGMFHAGQPMHPQMHPGMQMQHPGQFPPQMQQRAQMNPNMPQRQMMAHPMQPQMNHMPPPRSQPASQPMQVQPPPPGTPNSAGERENRVDQLTDQWIRQNCLADPNCVTPRGELYAAYVDDLRNQFHSLSGSLAMFSNIMKQIHPQVQFRMADNGLMMVAQGIRLCKPHKLAPAASAQAPAPPMHSTQPMNGNAHPIMKQMLTNPPPPNVPPTVPVVNGGMVNGRSYSSDSSRSHTPEPLVPIDKDSEVPEVKPDVPKKQITEKIANKDNVEKPKKEEIDQGSLTNGKQENGEPMPPRELMCEWDGCGELFATASGVLVHCSKEHMIDEIQPCKFAHCDGTPRNRWSLITHIQDHHATEAHLRMAAKKRVDGQAPAQPPAYRTDVPRDIPQHPGYSKHAAIDAIRRHAFNFLPRDITDEPEGPVTKSIRLTSCLILRNLARYSQEGRHILRRHERHLCWLALSRLEASHAIAQLLAELHSTVEPAVSTLQEVAQQ